MSTVINEGDLLLRTDSPRLRNITSNYIDILASSETFIIDDAGNYIPAFITYTPRLIGNLNGDVTWTVTRSDAQEQLYTVNSTTNVLTIDTENISVGITITIAASLTYLGETYTASKLLSTISGGITEGVVEVNANRLSFVKKANTTGGLSAAQPSTILLSASVSNIQNPQYFWTLYDEALNTYNLVQMPQGVPLPEGVQGVQGATLTNSPNYSIPSTVFDNISYRSKQVRLIVTGDNTPTGAEDTETVYLLEDGSTAVTVALENQNILINSSPQGLPYSGQLPITNQLNVVSGINYIYPPDVTYSVQGAQGFTSPVTINTSEGVPALGQPPGFISIPNLTQGVAQATFRATVGGVNYDRVLIAKKVIDGLPGNDSRTLSLNSTGLYFLFDSVSSSASSSANIDILAQVQNISATLTWTAQAFNSSNTLLGSVTLTGTGNARTLTSANFNALNATGTSYVKVTATAVQNSVTYSDTITISRLNNGNDAINMILSNEVHNVTASSLGVVPAGQYSAATTNVYVFKGTLNVTGQWTFTKIDSPSGFTTNLLGNGTDNVQVQLASFADGIDSGKTVITANPPAGSQGISIITKEFSITKTKAGAQGTQGIEGAQGSQGSSYWMLVNSTVNRSVTGEYNPTKITASMRFQQASMQGPQGFGQTRWKIETGVVSGGLVTWSTASPAIADSITSSESYTWPATQGIPAGIDLVRVGAYLGAPSNNVKLDEEVVAIVDDGIQGSQGATGSQGAQGATGAQGPASVSYWITTSSPVSIRKLTGAFDPPTITVEARQQTGGIGGVQGYTGGRLGFQVSQGAAYGTVQGPTGVQGTLSVTIPANTTKIKFIGYIGNSTADSSIYDSEEVLITGEAAPGSQGTQGAPATVYWMDLSTQSINIDKNNTAAPNNFSATIYSKSGTNPTTVYPGRFWVEKTTNGTNWTEIFKTAVGSTQGVYTQGVIPVDGSRSIRVRVYDPADTGFTNSLDGDTIALVKDGAQGAQGVQGAQGQQGVAYWMTLNSPALARRVDGSYSPTTITAQLYQKQGSSAPQGYAGRISAQVKLTTQGTLLTVEGTATNQTSYTFTPPLNMEYVIFKGYLANGNAITNQLITDQFDEERSTVLDDGKNSTAYWMVLDSPAVSRATNGTYSPTTITATLYSQTGTSVPQLYSGRITAEVLADGSGTYGTPQTSGVNTTSYTFTIPANTSKVRFRAYLAGGTTSLIDEEISSIIRDGANGAQGAQGTQGVSAISYSMVVAESSIKRISVGNYTPASITATLYSRLGAAARQTYAGRFIVEKSVSYGAYQGVLTSASDVSTVTIPLPTGAGAENWTSVRIRSFLAGGTTETLDEQVVTIVLDGAQGNAGAQGAQGNSSFGVEIASSGIFIKPTGGAIEPAGGIPLITAINNLTGATYQWSKQTNSTGAFVNISGATSNTYTVPVSDFSGAIATNTYKVTVVGSVNGASTTISDQETIIRVDDGDPTVNAVLSNSNVTVPASTTGTVLSYQGTGTSITVYEGPTALTYLTSGTPANGQWTFTRTIVPSTAGLLAGATTNLGTIASLGNYSNWTNTAVESAYITYTITGKTRDGVSFTLQPQQVLTKAKAGATGAANFSVSIAGDAVFVKPAGGTPTPSGGIVLTAVPVNITSPVYQWAKQTGSTGTFTNITGATTASYTVPAADFTSILTNTYRVTASGTANGGAVSVSDQQTVIRVDEGSAALTMAMSNDSVTVPTDNAGVVLSYIGTGTNINIYEGSTLLTYTTATPANGQYSVSTVVTPAAALTVGTRTATGLPYVTFGNASGWSNTVDTAYITFTATGKTRDGVSFSIAQTQILAKAKAGSTGARGSLKAYASQYSIYSATWVDGLANRVINNLLTGQSLTTSLATTTHLRIGDEVTITNAASATAAITRYWSGSAWVTPGTVIDGNLLVTGTISGTKIIAGTLQADRLTSGTAGIVGGTLAGGSFGLGDTSTTLIGNSYAVGKFAINNANAWALAAYNTSTATTGAWANGMFAATRASGVASIGYNIGNQTTTFTAVRSYGLLGQADVAVQTGAGGVFAALKTSSWNLTTGLDNAGSTWPTNLSSRYFHTSVILAQNSVQGVASNAGVFENFGPAANLTRTGNVQVAKTLAVLGQDEHSALFTCRHVQGVNITKDKGFMAFNSTSSGSGFALWIAGTESNSTTAVYTNTNLRVPGTVSTFTGSHEAESEVLLEQGDIVVDNLLLHKADFSNAIFQVLVSTQANQLGVLGVVERCIDRVTQGDDRPQIPISNFEMAPLPDQPWWKRYKAYINALGEGHINVCGQNGNIARGDLIVASDIAGKGMKQSDDIIRNYTVAKARDSVTFDYPTQIKQIACVYISG